MMSSLEATQADDALEYRGETRPRNRQVATLVTLLCPGLGYMYIGKPLLGLTINLLFILLVEIFVILQGMLKFFPLLPGLVLALSWIGFATLAALDVRERLATHGSEEYLLRSYNHWLPYSLMALLSFALPIFLSFKVTLYSLWEITALEHSGMAPTLLRGDVLLVDRSGFSARAPQPGEIVAVSSGKEGAPTHVLRVIATHKDTIRVEGDLVYINDEILEHEPLTLAMLPGLHDAQDASLMTLAERNREQRYAITMAKRAVNRTSVPPTEIGARELYLLTDNRSQVQLAGQEAKIRDSRSFGPVHYDRVRGRPAFILWSADPETGHTRWERIGLRVQP